MWVINHEKEREKIYLRNDTGSSITNISHESNEVQNIVSHISYAMSGAPSGSDAELTGRAKQALHSLSQCLEQLYRAQNLIEQLKTMEEIPDGLY
ncbi:hypothetical protein IJG04_00430 [Candidatus Saccharibacteria bacterium]|nr:hypothetical protein [Candidatus Saccharibacteria bacterium]